MTAPIALVMAGGGGTRLWPASRPERPKQLLDPFLTADGVDLLSATIRRLHGLVSADRIFVVTDRAQVDRLRPVLSGFHQDRIIAEPYGRNTAPCVALGLRCIRASLGSEVDDATILALPADHHVSAPDAFRTHLAVACEHARESNSIVTLGITPDRPATGYGYIEREAEPLPNAHEIGGIAIYRALRFVEKPDVARVREFLQSGRFLWNSGIFVMPFTRIEQEFERHCPKLWDALDLVADARRVGDGQAVEQAMERAYAEVRPAPIDTAVMEKVADLRVIPAEVGWADLGTWRSVYEALPKDANGNARATGKAAKAVAIDSRNSLIWAENGTVAIVGLEGVAVVESGGGILVCPLERVEEVRAVVDELNEP